MASKQHQSIPNPKSRPPMGKVEEEAVKLKERAKELVKPGKLLIDGQWVPAASGKTFATYNPATKEKLTEIAAGDAEDVDRAVKAARRAFESKAWRAMPPRERGRLLLRVAELIAKHTDDFALLETVDNGKVISDSRTTDAQLCLNSFLYYSGWPDKLYGDTVPVGDSFLNYTVREPVGVVGAITPWNFPIVLASWKVAPALACGCTVVLKPAEQTPLSTLRLGELLLEAGVPNGVVNIVPGLGATAGAALVKHMDVDKISFTGSTEVGRFILTTAGQTNLKRVSLELGGKSPQIVFADADLEAAVQLCVAGVFWNQGQICHAGSRIFVEESIHDKFVAELVRTAKAKKVGDPLRTDSELGAQVSQEQYEKTLDYVRIGKEEGARLQCGGAPAVVPGCDGYFVQPTVFTGVKNSMRIAQEEIFGPVVGVIPFKDTDDVVRQANTTIYGLAAAVWTRDVKKAHRVAHALHAGNVWINTYNAFDIATAWGGYKQSGIGREMGKHALELYTELKSVWVQL